MQGMSQQQSPITTTTNNKALVALILGILSIFLPFVGIILAILAVIFAVQGLKQSKYSGRKTMAIIGLVCGIITIILTVVMLVLVSIGALAYFGTLDPSSLLPDRCQFGPITCDQFDYQNGVVSAEMVFPETRVISGVSFSRAGAEYVPCPDWSGPVVVEKDAVFKLSCMVGEGQIGELEDINFHVEYNTGVVVNAPYMQTLFGEIRVLYSE